jgi:hypothetical protein
LAWLTASPDCVAARSHFESALAAFDSERDRDFAFRYGQDPVVATNLFLGLTSWALGDVNAREASPKRRWSMHCAPDT